MYTLKTYYFKYEGVKTLVSRKPLDDYDFTVESYLGIFEVKAKLVINELQGISIERLLNGGGNYYLIDTFRYMPKKEQKELVSSSEYIFI